MPDEKKESSKAGLIGLAAVIVLLFALNPNEKNMVWGFNRNQVKSEGLISALGSDLMLQTGAVALEYHNYLLFSTLYSKRFDGREALEAFGFLGFAISDLSNRSFVIGQGADEKESADAKEQDSIEFAKEIEAGNRKVKQMAEENLKERAKMNAEIEAAKSK